MVRASRLLNMERKALSVGAILAALAACIPEDSVAPRAAISLITLATGATNTLSTVVTFSTIGIDSARVEYGTVGEPTVATPCYRVRPDTTLIVALGLRSSTTYSYRVVGCGRAVSSTTAFAQSGPVPPELRDVGLDVTGAPTPGWILLAASRDSFGLLLAFDNTGLIRWYRSFALRQGEQALDGKQLANGDFAVFIGATQGWQPTYGRYFELRPDGEVVGTYVASAPYYTDNHELLVTLVDTTPDRLHLLGYDIRRLDLSRFGGPPDALVAGHTILRQGASGSVEFLWSAWDHFSLDDWIEPPVSAQQAANTDFDHPNSIDIDHDGNYVVSWRNFGEVTKIDAVTGRIIWRLGGRNNQFTILNDPLNGFSGQHDARVLSNGNLLLYDNGWRHTPPETRAVEYRLDTQAMTATLVWQYRHTPPLFTGFVGSVQRLKDGNTVVGYGALGKMTEVRTDGSVAWEGQLMIGTSAKTFFYRVRKLASLYRAGEP